ncbi:putative trypsin-6 [Zeugodacus cucurbitae]|uniref:putative trypsin-6 n=1 Tax=Zeugodacus cucurbitae TaxID=28588 RepID=UPI0010A744AC|nr:putative trypsin-6 [Zeugodacus cucurbitae]
MSKVNVLLIVFVLLQLTQLSSASAKNLTAQKGDYRFLVAGGLRVPELLNYTRFMVSLRLRTATKYFGDNHYCAGVIISYRWIVSSAQCLVYITKLPRRPRTIIAVIGTMNRIRRSPTTRLMAVDRVVVNLNFTLYGTNDIGLIRLMSPLVLNARVQIMALPTEPPPYGSRCIVLGWGRLYNNGPYAAMISQVDLLLYSEEQCQKAHPRYTPGDLCAGDKDKYDHDPCSGDSGGPLICNDKLVAVVSWTLGCGQLDVPSLYTDLYHNREWIKAAMEGQCSLSVLIEFKILMIIYLVFCYLL